MYFVIHHQFDYILSLCIIEMREDNNKLLVSNYIEQYFQTMMSEEELGLLHRNTSEIFHKSGELIIKQGSFISQILFLVKGMVKVVVEDKSLKNTILKIVGKNNFIDLSVFGAINQHRVSVFALCNSEVSYIKLDVLQRIMHQNSKINQFFLDKLARDTASMYNKISILSTRNNHGKLATALLYLSDIKFDKGGIIDFLTRKDLADLASISLESANKILLELKNDRIIEMDKKKIRILQPELLEVLSTIG